MSVKTEPLTGIVSTTALIVELVVVGAQAAVWLFLLISFLWMPDAKALTALQPLATALVLLSLVVFYSLGLIFDAVAALFEDRLVGSGATKKDKDKRAAVRAELRASKPQITASLDRDQYLLRLLRSTAFNGILIALIASFTVVRIHNLADACYLYLIAFYGIFLSLVFVFMRKRKRLRNNYRTELQESGQSPATVEKKKKLRTFDERWNCASQWTIGLLFIIVLSGVYFSLSYPDNMVVPTVLIMFFFGAALAVYAWSRRLDRFTDSRDKLYDYYSQGQAEAKPNSASKEGHKADQQSN